MRALAQWFYSSSEWLALKKRRYSLKTPQAIALISTGKKTTYNELELMIENLSRLLLKQDSKPGYRIGVWLERSAIYVACLLSIFKTGGIYVPLGHEQLMDPGLMEQLNLQLLISDKSLNLDLKIINPYEDLKISKRKKQHIQHNIDDPAYIISSSGTTGKAKAVIGSQRGIINRYHWSKINYPLSTKDIILHRAPFTFIASLWDILDPLLQGAATIISSEEENKNIYAILSLLKNHNVTQALFTPSLFDILLKSIIISNTELPSLKRILLGGEKISTALIKKTLQVLPQISLISRYGSTEAGTSIDTNLNFSTATATEQHFKSSLIHNCNAFILSGELCLFGDNVCCGYTDDLLNQEKFITVNIAGEKSSIKAFRTGDLFKFTKDGEFLYQGRKTDEVKINGIKVNLKFIEEHFNQFQSINFCFVDYILCSGKYKIVAYIKKKNTNQSSENLLKSIRKFSRNLPSIARPNEFHIIHEIPYLHTGKIDRKKLNELYAQAVQFKEEEVYPTDQLEIKIQKIWNTCFKHACKTTDNFMELGGHSLTALEMTSLIKQHCNIVISPAWVIEHQTIKEQIYELKQQNAKCSNIVFQLKKGTSKLPLLLFHPGHGGVECYASLMNEINKNQLIFGVDSYHFYMTSEKISSISQLAQFYSEHIYRKCAGTREVILGGYSFGGLVAFEVARILKENYNINIKHLLLIDTGFPSTQDRKRRLEYSDKQIKEFMLDNNPLVALDASKGKFNDEHSLNYYINIYKIITNWAPYSYEGRVTLIKASKRRGGYAHLLLDDNNWGSWVKNLTVHRLQTGHYSLMANEESRKAVAIIINNVLTTECPT